MHHTHAKNARKKRMHRRADTPPCPHPHPHTLEKGYTHSHTSACARAHTHLHAVLLERTKHLEGHFEKLPCDLGEGPHIRHHPLRVPQQQVHLYMDAHGVCQLVSAEALLCMHVCACGYIVYGCMCVWLYCVRMSVLVLCMDECVRSKRTYIGMYVCVCVCTAESCTPWSCVRVHVYVCVC